MDGKIEGDGSDRRGWVRHEGLGKMEGEGSDKGEG